MRSRYALVIPMLTTMYACGAHQKSGHKLQDNLEAPLGAIIAVRDDGSVNSTANLDELRVVKGLPSQKSADQVQEQELPDLYKQSQKPDQVLSQEQVQVSQTETRGWFHYRQCPGRLIRLAVEVQQEPVILDSCQAYHQYQPVYLLRGHAHRFFFQRAYRLQNVTYYYYANQAPMQQDDVKQIEQSPAVQDQTVKQEQEMKQKPETKQTEQKPDCPKPDLTQKPIVKKLPSKC